MSARAGRPTIRVSVALPRRVHARAEVVARQCGLTLAAWLAEVVEVAAVPERCGHGSAARDPEDDPTRRAADEAAG